MSIKSRFKKRELVPSGTHNAICTQVIHIGTVPTKMKDGKTADFDKIRFTFELPNLQGKDGANLTVGQEFVLSLNEGTMLRKFIENWRGKKLSDKDVSDFDISVLINKTCLLGVIINDTNKDKPFEMITTALPLPAGTKLPKATTLTGVWDYENPDKTFLSKLPKYIVTKIQATQEFAELETPNHSDAPDVVATDDDLPF